MNAPVAHVDFETRSACSLRKSGAWRYSRDESTEILCMAFRLPYWDEGVTALWHPAFPALGIEEADCYDEVVELVDWIQSGELVEAHNAAFERCIWGNILSPVYGFPDISIHQWRCSASKAAAHALPRSLADAADALHLTTRKDDAGHKVMMKVSKPRKSRKKERETWDKAGVPHPAILWHESRELFEQLGAYCRQDILAEEALSNSLDDLSPEEQTIYTLDQTINERGFQLDREAVDVALRLIAGETKKLNAELATVTGGKVKKATQRAQMMAWFEGEGLELFDTQKETLDEVVKREDLEPHVRRALELVRTLGRSSTAKFQAMDNWMDPEDARVRGGLLYHGATTGRWSGAGVQPHNFVRGGFKKGAPVQNMDDLWAVLKGQNPTAIEECCGMGVMESLANSLRGAIVAAPGKQLFVMDYASIEARVLLWVAEDEDALDVFRTGQDIYCYLASDIYKRPVTKADAAERQLGKQGILGLGYQMGWQKFQATCAKYGIIISDELAQSVVAAYREKFWRVKHLWNDEEAAAIAAVLRPGQNVACGYVNWCVEGRFLFCTLPSGRRLAYPFPEVRERATPWGAMKNSLTFKGVDPYVRQWRRQTTYGGSIVENIVQAISRDIMAEAMLRCEQAGYPVVLTIHDEIVAESATGDLKSFEKLVAVVPDWAEELPIATDGFCASRYRK